MLEKAPESPLDIKEIKPVNLKGGHPEYSLEGLMLKLKLQYFCHLMRTDDSLEKFLMLGKIEGKEKRVSEDEMAGWYHQCNKHELGQTPGDLWVREAWTAAVLGVSNSQTQMGD